MTEWQPIEMVGSVDAAMATIPDGWRLNLTQDDWPNAPGKWGCELYGPLSYTLAPADPRFQYQYARGGGETAARAIARAVSNIKPEPK